MLAFLYGTTGSLGVRAVEMSGMPSSDSCWQEWNVYFSCSEFQVTQVSYIIKTQSYEALMCTLLCFWTMIGSKLKNKQK